MQDWVCLILRICLGVVFVGHGLQKAFGLFSGPGIDGFSQFLSSLGFKPAIFWAYLAAYVELVGGLSLLLGIFTRIAAAFILILIIVAALKVHITKGFFLQSGGFEYTFVLACICLALMLMGPGRFVIKR